VSIQCHSDSFNGPSAHYKPQEEAIIPSIVGAFPGPDKACKNVLCIKLAAASISGNVRKSRVVVHDKIGALEKPGKRLVCA
jgi:hypothetical protein